MYSTIKGLLLLQLLTNLSCFSNAERGLIHETTMDSKYVCGSSSAIRHAVGSEIQCVHRCLHKEHCALMNFLYQSEAAEKNCEMYVVADASSCSVARGKKGWKALMLGRIVADQDRANSTPKQSVPNDTSTTKTPEHVTTKVVAPVVTTCPKRNYNKCFPCKYANLCSSSEICSCNGTGVTAIPDIYIAFESLISGSTKRVPYIRGQDANSRKYVYLDTNAELSKNSNGPRKSVLRLKGEKPKVNIGDFASTYLDNPVNQDVAIAFWVQIFDSYDGQQTLFASGSVAGSDYESTGISMRTDDRGDRIIAHAVTKTSYLKLGIRNLGTVIRHKWGHLALTLCDTGTKMNLYVNGVQKGTTAQKNGKSVKKKTMVKSSGKTTMDIGASPHYDDGSEEWGLFMDDLAIWNRCLTKDEIAKTMSETYHM